MLKSIFSVLVFTLAFSSSSTLADSYVDQKNGKKYLCEEVAIDVTPASSCFCDEEIFSPDRPEGCARIHLYQVKGTKTSEIESWWECSIPKRKFALRSCEAAARSDSRCC